LRPKINEKYRKPILLHVKNANKGSKFDAKIVQKRLRKVQNHIILTDVKSLNVENMQKMF
jgi:hypothetical protein